jgi:hypothetical protein
VAARVRGERRRIWRRERERRGRRWGERRERDREALSLFFLGCNVYIASLLIVLGRLLLCDLMRQVLIDVDTFLCYLILFLLKTLRVWIVERRGTHPCCVHLLPWRRCCCPRRQPPWEWHHRYYRSARPRSQSLSNL